MVAFAAAFLQGIKGPSPGGMADGFAGPLMEALAQEAGSTPAPMDPHSAAAALGDGGNAAEHEQIVGSGIAIALGAEGNQQTRGKGLARSGQVPEQVGFGMMGKALLDL